MFRLDIYQKIDTNLHKIDSVFSDDREYILALAKERKAKNEAYVCIVQVFEKTDAILV